MTIRLPILERDPSPPSADLVRMFHRAYLHWRQHLAEEIPCDVGTALVSASQPAFNAILDAALPDSMTAADAWASVQEAFARHGGCDCWIMNPSAAPQRVGPLIHELTKAGFSPRTQRIFHLNPATAARSAAVLSATTMKILPARAALVQSRELAERAADELRRPLQAEASMLHLDDGHYDALIALSGSQPAARIGVLAVGDAGLIEELHVLKPFRGHGLGRVMLARAIEICTRSQFRHAFMTADTPCPVGDHLLPDAGFRKVGEFTIYTH